MNFEQMILAYEPQVRLGFFVSVFLIVALWELAKPRRVLKHSRQQRWTANLGIVVINTLTVRMVFPTAAVGIAALSAEQGWGLLNHFAVPFWLAVTLAVVAMDFVVWLQHVMVHAVPVLWRLHQVHHADLDYDLTTGARFHPLEIFLSMGIKFAAIVLLGTPVVAVVIFEVLLSACAMFNHGNLHLPASADRVLRWFMVTPDMHRVHHSTEDDESNNNFGFNLTWWDRCFGTYQAEPRAGQVGMTIGIRSHTDPQEVARLPGLLAMPFRRKVMGYAINRRTSESPTANQEDKQ